MGLVFSVGPDRRYLNRLFDEAWKALEKQGRCDAVRGMEWYRVWSAWCAAGRPGPIKDFILKEL